MKIMRQTRHILGRTTLKRFEHLVFEFQRFGRKMRLFELQTSGYVHDPWSNQLVGIRKSNVSTFMIRKI